MRLPVCRIRTVPATPLWCGARRQATPTGQACLPARSRLQYAPLPGFWFRAAIRRPGASHRAVYLPLLQSDPSASAHTLPHRPRSNSRRICSRRHRCVMDERVDELRVSMRPQHWGDFAVFCRIPGIYRKADAANADGTLMRCSCPSPAARTRSTRHAPAAPTRSPPQAAPAPGSARYAPTPSTAPARPPCRARPSPKQGSAARLETTPRARTSGTTCRRFVRHQESVKFHAKLGIGRFQHLPFKRSKHQRHTGLVRKRGGHGRVGAKRCLRV